MKDTFCIMGHVISVSSSWVIMKNLSHFLLVVSAAFTLFLMSACGNQTEPSGQAEPAGQEEAVAQEETPGEQVRHIVVVKYKEGATPDQIQQITDGFRALKDSIPGIVSFEHGVNNSPEGLNQGFTHPYVLTFEDAAARDAYLPHPEHQQFVNQLNESGIFEGAFVVDYVPVE